MTLIHILFVNLAVARAVIKMIVVTCVLSWSDDKMNAYMKHQASLERKRVAKKRARESRDNDPFLSACTGVGGNDLVLSDEVIVDLNDELASSVATSATKQQVEQLVVASVSELGSSLRNEIISDIDSRFNSLSSNFLDVLNNRLDKFEHVTNNSLPAPHPAPAPPILAQDQSDLSRKKSHPC